jgi:hypothetical protein
LIQLQNMLKHTCSSETCNSDTEQEIQWGE